MPDAESVALARKKVGAAYTALLRDVSDRQISQAGSKKTREQLPEIAEETGLWKDEGVASKPLAWLIHFAYDRNAQKWRAYVPNAPHARRLTGTFNTKSPLQGVLCRLLPVMRIDQEEPARYQAHPYWEWGLAFVFPDLAVFTEGGSSGATIDFDHNTGRLVSIVDTKEMEQPYVAAALFDLTSRDDALNFRGVNLTYGQASDELRSIITIAPVAPPPVETEE